MDEEGPGNLGPPTRGTIVNDPVDPESSPSGSTSPDRLQVSAPLHSLTRGWVCLKSGRGGDEPVPPGASGLAVDGGRGTPRGPGGLWTSCLGPLAGRTLSRPDLPIHQNGLCWSPRQGRQCVRISVSTHLWESVEGVADSLGVSTCLGVGLWECRSSRLSVCECRHLYANLCVCVCV